MLFKNKWNINGSSAATDTDTLYHTTLSITIAKPLPASHKLTHMKKIKNACGNCASCTLVLHIPSSKEFEIVCFVYHKSQAQAPLHKISNYSTPNLVFETIYQQFFGFSSSSLSCFAFVVAFFFVDLCVDVIYFFVRFL